jgi:hypothetical protein
MPLFRKLLCLAGFGASLALAVTGSCAVAGSAPPSPGFVGGSFTCLQFNNGLGDNALGRMQSAIARIWVHGYLVGYYKKQDKLEVTEDPNEGALIENVLVQTCAENPQASILSVALRAVASEARKVPKTVGVDFNPSEYTCGQHVNSKNGAAAAANRADLAELWAFGFVQGYKNVNQPDVEIRPEYKTPVLNAVNKACGSSKDKLFMDMTAAVADKVKIEN